MEIKDIIKVETLPKIVQQLEQLSVEIDNEVEKALKLECNEESKQEVKKAKANLNKIKTELEDRRKFVKEQILEPYYQFEDIYNNLIKEKLLGADDILKNRINEIENIQKQEKEEELLDYFTEYLDSIHLENIVQFEQLNIKVGLSDSMKKLREQVKCKLDSIANDIKLIELEENSNEIMVEYLKDFDFAKAKLTVVNRLNQMQKIEEEKQKRQEQEQVDKKLEEAVNTIVIPTEELQVNDNNKKLFTRFEVEGTLEEIINLKKFMVENNYKFKNI